MFLVATELNCRQTLEDSFKEGEMKKLYILLLALAIAAFAVPAMAGDISMEGEYTFGGEAWDEDGDDYGTFYDELDLDVEVTMGDVLFHWDIEIVDDPNFDRADDEGGLNTDNDYNIFATTTALEAKPNKLVDGFYVKWQATDALAVKIGEYGLGWGADIVLDAPNDGVGNVGIMYDAGVASLAFYLAKLDEDGEDDDDWMAFTAEGEIGPAEVGLVYMNATLEASDGIDPSTIGVYADFAAGPVGVYLEYGSDSSDGAGDGGTVILAEFGLDDLVGFGLSLSLVQTNEDWANLYGNDFDRVKIFDAEPPDSQLVFVNAEYGYSDELTLGADVMVMADQDGDDLGTEFDVWATYGFADNVSAEFGYASYSEGDFAVGDATVMWHEWVFEF
jgi:hypothetical protein